MFVLDRILTTTFLSSETLTEQGHSSVLAEKLRRCNVFLQITYTHLQKQTKNNYVIFLHKIRVDGTAGGVFRELVHDISG